MRKVRRLICKLLLGVMLLLNFELIAQSNIKLITPYRSEVSTDTIINFNWGSSVNFDSYELQLASDSLFTAVVVDSSQILNKQCQISPLAIGTYYWRVRGFNGAVPQSWSNFRSLKIINIHLSGPLVFWWDSDYNVISDGLGRVSAWSDKSGNNNDGLQTDTLKQPILIQDSLNGHNIVAFDGNTQSVVCNTFSSNPPSTLFFIYHKKFNGINEYIFDGGGADQFRLSVTSDNDYLLYAGNFMVAPNAGNIGYKILSLRQNGATSFIRSNLNLVGNGNPGSTPITGFSLGKYGITSTNPTIHANFDAAEVIMFSDTLSLSDMKDIEHYLQFKYAPPVSIGENINSTVFCSRSLSAQTNYQSYQWSTGETTKTISVSQSGTYWLTVTDAFGFTSSDTVIVNFPQINNFTDTIFCQGNTVVWNTNFDKNLYSFQWSDSSNDSLLTINQTGQYYATITDTSGCTFFTDTISAIRDDISSQVSLGPDASLCSGNIITLQSGNGPGLSYLWSNSSNNDTISISSSGQYSIIVTDTNNCTGKDTINVTVVGQAPVAGFEIGTACQNFSVSFTDTSYALSGNTITYWHWEFNDPNSSADTSILQNPNYTFTDSGTYTITLFINTDVGCFQAINKSITVHGNPIVTLGADTNLCSDQIVFPTSIVGNSLNLLWNTGLTNDTIPIDTSGQYILTVTNAYNCFHSDTINITVVGEAPFVGFTNPIICNSNQITFTDTSYVTLGNTIASWNWDFGDTTLLSDTSNIQHPVFTFNSPGDYTITLSITSNVGCTQSITKNVTVNPVPSVSLGADTSLCSGNYINPVSIIGTSLSFIWNTGILNDTLVVDTSGQYILTATTAFGCNHSDTINVTVSGQAPIAGFFNPLLCSGYTINFTDTSSTTSGNITSWFWDFGDNTTTNDTSNLQHPTYVFSDSGSYNIQLTLVSDVGCAQVLSKNIYVNKKPIANFMNAIVCQNDSVLFNNTSQSFGADPTIYNWNFGDPASGAANTSVNVNPKHLFASTGSYQIALITTSAAGCADTSTQTITANQQILPDFTIGKTCLNEPITFTDNSNVPLPNNGNIRTWTINSNNFTGTTVNYTFPTSGIYPVNLYINGVNGCTGSITKSIQVFEPPTPNFISLNGCEFDTISPIENSGAGGSPITQWSWSINGSGVSFIQNPDFINLSPATYNLTLAVTDSAYCKDSITKTLTVYNLPVIDFVSNPTTFFYTNYPVTFSPLNSNGIAFNWTIEGTNTNTQNTNHTFTSEGLFPVTLTQTDSNNCTNSKTKNLTVLNYRLDLAVTAVRASIDNNNFISVEADITNLGSVPVSSYDISYNITNTSTVLESWSGSPNTGALFTYTFGSKIQLLDNPGNYLTCVTIMSVNGSQDQNPANNSYCISSDLSNIIVSEPFPNPANEEILIPVVLTDELPVTFDVYDHLGQTVLKQQLIDGTQGLNIFNLPIETLSVGQYFLKITIKDKIFVKKITKSY